MLILLLNTEPAMMNITNWNKTMEMIEYMISVLRYTGFDSKSIG